MSRTSVIVSDSSERFVENTSCRLCMKNHGYYFNIFISNEACKINMEKAIRDLLCLKVTVGDGLPNTICFQCVRKLVEYSEFREMCLKSDAELRRCAMGNDVRTIAEDTGAGNLEVDYKVLREEIAGNDFFEAALPHLDSKTLNLGDNGETSGRGNVDHSGNSCEGTTVFIHPASPGLCDQGKVKVEMDDSDSEGEWESHSGPMNVEDGIEHTVGSSLSSDPLAAVSSVDRRYETCGIPERSLKTSESSSVPVLEDQRDLKPVVSDAGDVSATWEDQTGKFETVSAEESFRSENCGQEFSHGSASFYHVGTHGNGTVFNCELCDKRFVTKTDLMNHVHLHTDSKQFKGHICHEEFGRRDELKAQAFTHAGLKVFKCDVCGEEYNQRSELKAHEVTHAVSKMFKCDVCGKEFSHVSSLRTHATTHFDLKPHKCEVCGKSFKRRDHLNMHRTIHTGLKPFRCEICGKCFNRKDKVKTHSRIHNKTKAYSCHVCGKGFHRKNDLLLHLSTHSDSKPFKCVVCDKSFAHGKYLKSHLDTHLDTHDILDLL